MLTPVGQITPVCIVLHTHIFTVWQISLFRSGDIMLCINIISIQPVLHLVLPEIYKMQCSSFKHDYGNGVGIYLVVCPLLAELQRKLLRENRSHTR